MSYESDVAEAKQLLQQSEDAQWRLAELTYTVVEAETSRRQCAQDVGFSHEHANRLYELWERWRGNSELPPFWDCYRKLQTGDDEATNDSFRAEMDLKRAARVLVENPQVAAQVLKENPRWRPRR